jgi:putative ABC transport system permease protein
VLPLIWTEGLLRRRLGRLLAAAQGAYFVGGTARELLGRLAGRPDAVLVSAETVHDFQLVYVGGQGVPTAPRDSVLAANADYVTARTGDPSVGSFLVDAGGARRRRVAERIAAWWGIRPL